MDVKYALECIRSGVEYESVTGLPDPENTGYGAGGEQNMAGN
jgi:hypothetical protein